MLKIGIDTGGTFTDFIFVKEGIVKTLKIKSTPENPAKAVLEGIEIITSNYEEPYKVIHGSTVATNTLLTRSGAKTALITTEGFEDIIEIGRQNRPHLYDIYVKKEPPIIPYNLRFGISERILYTGDILKELDIKNLEKIVSILEEKQVESIAISLLFSYVNPIHEKKIAKYCQKLGIPISISSEILPEYREYERTSTVAVNAYVSPVMINYISNIEKNIKGKLSIMQSNGGIISPSFAKNNAVRTILSGPAGGVLGGLKIAQNAGYTNIITFDMGGTSTDVSLCKGDLSFTNESFIGGCPIKIPMIDIHTVGAGGGSIAYVDEGKVLKVGPKSAGAIPGPICYGTGDKVTVTDAHFILGRLDKEHFLGGNMQVYPERIFPYLEKIANHLYMDVETCAQGIIDIANCIMARAIRVVSLQRGYDPRDFTLVAFGGTGPLHACELAEELSIPLVLIPKNPGLIAAYGMILSDTIKDYSQTVLKREISINKVDEIFKEIVNKAFFDMLNEGFSKERIFIKKMLDLRYVGQSYEITIPYTQDFIENFHLTHQSLYGHSHKDKSIEIVNVRVQAIGINIDKPSFQEEKFSGINPSESSKIGIRKILYRGKSVRTPLYLREKLKVGNKIEGPAIIVEYSSTTFIPPNFYGKVDNFLNLILQKVS